MKKTISYPEDVPKTEKKTDYGWYYQEMRDNIICHSRQNKAWHKRNLRVKHRREAKRALQQCGRDDEE